MAKAKQQLPTFDLINVYNEETVKSLDLQAQYSKKVLAAQALVSALNMQYEAAVTSAVVEGVDNAAEIDELNEQLSNAESDLLNKKRMQQVALHVNKRTVTQEDIERELREYQEKYQKEIIEPSEEELRKAKEQYFSMFMEHMRKIKHFEAEARKAFFTVNPSYGGYSIPYSVGFKTQQNVERKCITETDLTELERGQRPSSLGKEGKK